MCPKFVCENCGYVETVRKPLKEVKQGATKCPQCDNLNREAVKYFRLTADSEDADLPFKDFSLSDRELLNYINLEKQKTCIQVFAQEKFMNEEIK